MIKKLFRKSFINISFLGVGTVFNAALGFLYLSAIAKDLPISDFGKYALLTSLLLSVSKILDFGTNSIYVAKSISESNKNLVNTFLSNKIVQFLIALPISIIILFALNLSDIEIITYFIFGVLFYGVYYSLFGLFQKEENYLMLILMATIPALIKGVMAILILTNIINWEYTSYFGLFSLSISTSLIFFAFVPNILKTFKLNFSSIWSDLKIAFSPGISQLISESFSAVSNTLTKIVFGFADVGIFSLADKISNAFVLVSYSIFTVLLPKNATRKKENKEYDYTETKILSIGVLILSLFVIFIAKIAVPWFFENKYDDSLGILNILVFSGAVTAIHTFMENYFYVEEKTKILGIISIAKLFFYVISASILVTIFSLKGLAIAHFASSVITLIWVSKLVFIVQQKKTSSSQSH